MDDSTWVTFPMPRTHHKGGWRKSKTRYTVFRKGNTEPLIVKGTVKECADLMGVQENYIYVMLVRNKGENGTWKIEKTVLD